MQAHLSKGFVPAGVAGFMHRDIAVPAHGDDQPKKTPAPSRLAVQGTRDEFIRHVAPAHVKPPLVRSPILDAVEARREELMAHTVGVMRSINRRTPLNRLPGLDESLRYWNLYEAHVTEYYRLGRRDFAGTYLYEARLTGQILTGSDFSGADLLRTGFERANLTGAKFVGATMWGTYFDGADLTAADLTGAYLGRDDAIHSSGARLQGAILRDAILRDAVLADADLTSADLRGADLRGARFHALEGFRSRTSQDAILTGTDLRGANLEGHDLDWFRSRGAIVD